MKLSEQEAVLTLNALLTGWQMMELLDSIKEISIYRQGVKHKLNLLLPELEKLVDNVEVLFDSDVEAMNNLMEHKRELSLKIASMRPEEWAGLNCVIAEYFSNPELTKHRLGIGFIEKQVK